MMLESLPHAEQEPDRSSFPQETLGNTLITIDHPKFLEGYLAGYTNYTQVGRYLPHSGAMLREVLLQRCTGQPNQPGAASTGYVLGWITAMQGLPRRKRLCSLDVAPAPPQEATSISEPTLAETVPSLFAHPDFACGLEHGRLAYHTENVFPGEADHPSEQELIHFFGGQVSSKAHNKHYQAKVSYLYRIGFALAQLNRAVETMGAWPVSGEDACDEPQSRQDEATN